MVDNWETAARRLDALGADADGELGLGLMRSGIDAAIIRWLEAGGLVSSTVAEPLAALDRARGWRLTPSGCDLDAVLGTLFGPGSDASRMTTRIVAALYIGRNPQRGGWVSDGELATVLRVRLRRMRRHLDRLRRVGLLERAPVDAGQNRYPGRQGVSRLGLRWAPALPSQYLEAAKSLLGQCRESAGDRASRYVVDPHGVVKVTWRRSRLRRPRLMRQREVAVEITWRQNHQALATGVFTGTTASVRIELGEGCVVGLFGDDARAVRDCGADGHGGWTAGELPAEG